MEFNATFLATIITFIIFVFLMNKVLYAPILNIIEQRKSYVNGNYETAKKNDEKSEKLVSKKEEKLLVAKNEAKEAYNETIGEFKTEKAKIITEAQEKAKVELENSKKELEKLSNETTESLKNSMTDLANDIVEKVIGYRSEVQGFDNQKIDEILYHWDGK